MKHETGDVGKVKRSLFATWRVEVDEFCSVSFPFTSGFGCGASFKVVQGQRLSLQTQYKLGSQIGSKIGVSGVEISSGISSEISETLVHELSETFEWSYTSRPCEYCNPQIHFPSARVTIWSRRPLHLPLFVTRKTIFTPGDRSEIKAHCHHNPEECENCNETPAAPGQGSVLTATKPGGATHLERVVLAERTPGKHDQKQFLKDILSTPDDESAPDQLYLLEFNEKTVPIHTLNNQYALYSLDDVDRALGAVRLYTGTSNRLFLLTKDTMNHPTNKPKPEITLFDENIGDVIAQGSILGEGQRNDFRFIEVDFQTAKLKSEPDGLLKLQVYSKEGKSEWPVILFGKEVATSRAAPVSGA